MVHVREPYTLDDHKYGEWSLDFNEFLGDDRSLPHRPTHLVADIAAKGLAFRLALDAMNTALANRKTASDLIKNTVEDMEKLLRNRPQTAIYGGSGRCKRRRYIPGLQKFLDGQRSVLQIGNRGNHEENRRHNTCRLVN